MKKFVCNRVRFIEDRYVTSITGGEVNFAVGKNWTALNLSNANFSEELAKSFAGKQIIQTLQVDGEFPASIANRIMLPLIFELTLSDGRVIVWGSKEIRCKVKSETYSIGNGVVGFERKTKQFEL